MSDTGPSKIPGLPVLRSGNKAIDDWAQRVAETLEVRNGSRGNPKERAVTLRELEAAQAAGQPGTVDMDALVAKLLADPRFEEALRRRVTSTTAAPAALDETDAGRLRGEMSALSSRVRALQAETSNSYGAAFEYVGGRWRIKGTVGVADVDFNFITAGLYWTLISRPSEQEASAADAHTNGIAFNPHIRFGNSQDTNAWTFNMVRVKVEKVEARFDGSGRLRRENLPFAEGYDIINVLIAHENKLNALRAHTGYTGEW